MFLQPGRYRQYKGPHNRVLDVARHSETEEWLVVYQTLYGDYGLWVRPLGMFTETVEVDGQQVPIIGGGRVNHLQQAEQAQTAGTDQARPVRQQQLWGMLGWAGRWHPRPWRSSDPWPGWSARCWAAG